MTAESPSPGRRAAAGILDVEPGASPDQARSTFLRRLDEARLVPPPHVRAAAAEFGLFPHGPASRAVIDQQAEAIHAAAVERFADAYWALPPGDRRARWAELVRGAESFPRLSARLDGLAGGLDVVLPGAYGDPSQTRLAEAVIELYPLRPARRARRRAQLLPRVGDLATLRAAARAIRRDRPALLSVDHGLLGHLAAGRASVRPLRTSRPDPRDRVEEPVRTSGGGGSAPRWVVIVCILGVMGLVRVGSQIGRQSSGDKDPAASRAVPYRGPTATSVSGQPPEHARPLAEILGRRVKVNPGLTPAQMGILRRLSGRKELGQAEANAAARAFLAAGRSGAAGLGPPGKREPLVLAPEPSFTLAQQRIQERLARDNLPEETVSALLVMFVENGPPTFPVPRRP